MTENKPIGRSHSRKHYHEQSMDDFMKNIRKFNLRSQRYISNRPFNMYIRQNTTKTMEKSRSQTLSNRKSLSKSKRVKKKVQNMLSQGSAIKTNKTKKKVQGNVAQLIQNFSEKIKKVEKYLEHKNQIGLLLCHKFTQMLNQIIQTTIVQLNHSLQEVEKRTMEKIQKIHQKQVQKLTKYNQKLQIKTQQLLNRLENNSSLLYNIRMHSDIDVDYLFGVTVLGTDKCGGLGYGKSQQTQYYPQDYELEENDEKQPEQSGRIRPAMMWEKEAHERNEFAQFKYEVERKSL